MNDLCVAAMSDYSDHNYVSIGMYIQVPTSIGNCGDCPRRKTHPRAPPYEELDPAYNIRLVFVQKITFVLRKINKNYCHQSCTF